MKTKLWLCIPHFAGLILILLFSAKTFAQKDSTQVARKNILGIYLITGYNHGYGIKYEHLRSDNFSWGCFADSKRSSFQSVDTANTKPLIKQWYSVTPFARYYFGEKKTMPKGFFVQGNLIINYHNKWIVTYGDSVSGSGGSYISSSFYYPLYTETRSFLSVGVGAAIGFQFLIKKRVSFDINLGAKWVPYPIWIPKSKTVNGVSYDLVTYKKDGSNTNNRINDPWGWRNRAGAPGNILFIQWSIGYTFK